jgi:hypothetical protein
VAAGDLDSRVHHHSYEENFLLCGKFFQHAQAEIAPFGSSTVGGGCC